MAQVFPGLILLVGVAWASHEGLCLTARELKDIWDIRLELLAGSPGDLVQGETLCRRIYARKGRGLACSKSVALHLTGSDAWREGCPAARAALEPVRWVRLRLNCAWQTGDHILRLPPADFTFKR